MARRLVRWLPTRPRCAAGASRAGAASRLPRGITAPAAALEFHRSRSRRCPGCLFHSTRTKNARASVSTVEPWRPRTRRMRMPGIAVPISGRTEDHRQVPGQAGKKRCSASLDRRTPQGGADAVAVNSTAMRSAGIGRPCRPRRDGQGDRLQRRPPSNNRRLSEAAVALQAAVSRPAVLLPVRHPSHDGGDDDARPGGGTMHPRSSSARR